MLLLTMQEHLFTGTHIGGGADERKQRTLAFATDLDLIPALERIKAYERAYKQRYPRMAVEFNLLAVSTVPGSAAESKKTLHGAMVDMVESLAQTPEALDD